MSVPFDGSDSRSSDQDINPGSEVTRELFLEWRSPRTGRSNPERMNNPVWEWLIRSRLHAYTANQKLAGPDSMDAGPCWCFNRFGQSSTPLPDGRTVLISGEHEDSYDPDFYIYNDVVVLHPDGRIDVFGYPKDVFPPTDSHSATLVGNRIIIIGNIGYPEQRKPGITPVFILSLGDFSISPAVTHGKPPGWLHKHTASLAEGSSILIQHGKLHRGGEQRTLVENIDDWRLDIANWRRERLTERKWQQWEIRRKDGKNNRLWELQIALWERKAGPDKEFKERMERLTQGYGVTPNLDLVINLYRPGVSHEPIEEVEGENRIFRIRVEGVVVRYVDDTWSIQMTVEGELPQETIDALTSDLVEKMIALENTSYELKRL
jgi:hypothetical protein